MGLLDMLMGGQADSRSDLGGQAMTTMGGGAPSAPTLSDRLSNPLSQIGLQMMAASGGPQVGYGQSIAKGLANADALQKKNRMLEVLRTQHPDIAGMVDMGLEPGDAYNLMMKRQAEEREQKRYDANQAFAREKFDYERKHDADTLAVTRSRYGADAEQFGVSPIYGRDAEGNTVLLQAGDRGTVRRSGLPDGITPLSPYDTNYQKAEGTARGKGQGEAGANLGSVEDAGNLMLSTIQSIEGDPYRKRGTGFSSILNKVPATGGYDFQQKVDQLKGQTFLQAFNTLRGGGQITEAEGAKATQALARLDTAQSEEAFNAALNDLKSVIAVGLSRARAKASQPAPAPTAAPPSTSGATDYRDRYGLE